MELEMRAWLVFFGGAVAALLSVFALDHVLPASWSLLPSLLYGVIVIGTGLGTQLIKRHRARVNHTAEEGSIEREIAQRAASGTYGAALVAMLLFGLYLVLQDQFADALVLYLLLWAVIGIHWVRYAIIRDRLT